MIKGRDTDEAGVLARRIKVLEVVCIDDGVYGRDRTDSYNAADKVIRFLECFVAFDYLQHLLLDGFDNGVLLADKTLASIAALGCLIVAKFALLRGQSRLLTHIQTSFTQEIG